MDIECLAQAGNGLPQPQSDPIIMISLAFSEPFRGRKDLVLVARPVRISGAQGCENEEEMLKRFIEILRRYDPDVLVGYNSNEFDLPYLIDRMSHLGIRPRLGRADKQSYYRRMGGKTRVDVTGRIVVDSMTLVKKDFPLKSYTLAAVSKQVLGEEKLDVKHTEIPSLWRDNGEGLRKLVDYSRKDAWLALELLLSKRLLDRYIALAQASGTCLQDLVDGGQSVMIDNLLLKELGKVDRVMPCKPDDEETARREELREREGLKGGHVLEPETGLQENVIIMDYKSLYPTIMIANNICFSTLTENGFVAREKYRGIVPRILEELLEKRLILKKKAKEAKKTEEFRILDMTQWAVKILLNSFYGYFGYTRSRMYELTIANAVTRTGRENITKTKEIIEKEIGVAALKDETVFLGPEVDDSGSYELLVSLSVVYGDTDSVFVKLSPQGGRKDVASREASLIGSKLGKVLTRLLPPPMELEYEAFARRALFVTKKRYALYMEDKDPPIKVKGLETVRREWCNLATEAMTTVLDLVLRKGEVEEATEYIKGLIDDLRNNRTPLEKLIQTRTLSRRPQDYKGRQPHLELYKKIRSRDPASAPQIGDRVPFVIVQGKGLLVQRAEDPAYVVENGLKIDHEYYIRRQILPPLRRIFEALGLTIDELVADTSQLTLLDTFAKKRPSKPRPAARRRAKPAPVLGVELEEFLCPHCEASFTVVDLTEFRCPECGEELDPEISARVLSEVAQIAERATIEEGKRTFVCAKCGREYRRMPLSGLCDCSGQVVPRPIDADLGGMMDLIERAPTSLQEAPAIDVATIRQAFEAVESDQTGQMTLADFI